jgi:hypothetical protein
MELQPLEPRRIKLRPPCYARRPMRRAPAWRPARASYAAGSYISWAIANGWGAAIGPSGP